VRAIGEEGFEPRFQFRYGIGFGNAECVKSVRAGSFRERGFYRRRITQKSRSA